MESILAAFITGLLTLAGVIFSNMSSTRKTEQKIEMSQAVTDAKIEELTREVREHNNFARRVPVIEEQMKVANHRISDLEEEEKRHGQK